MVLRKEDYMDINIVKQRVVDRGYIPLFFSYNKNTDKLLVKTQDGYLGYITNNGLNRGDKISVFSIHNPYTIYNIQMFIKNKGLGCKLLTDKWVSHDTPLLLECSECHKEYECLWDTLKEKPDGLCQNCINEKLARQRRNSINIVKEMFIKKGYTPLFEEYKSNTDKLLVKDSFGYLGEMTYKQLINGSGFRPFHPKNQYTLTNIRLLLDFQGSGSELLSTEYINNSELMSFRCECGETYTTSLTSILRGVALRCERCNKSQSNLETIVEQWMKEHKLKYKKQYRFIDCRNMYPLPFDFMLIINGVQFVIEVNGVQHYEPVAYFGGEEKFEYRVNNDKIKKSYCKDKNIKYIEISYKDIASCKYKEILKNILP